VNVKVQLPNTVHGRIGLMLNVVYEEALLWVCMHLLCSRRVVVENRMLLRNKYGLKKPGDFTVFKGHMYPHVSICLVVVVFHNEYFWAYDIVYLMLYNWGGGVRSMGWVGFRNKGSRRRGLTLYLNNF
jgi:hypothetical protein